MDVLIQLKDYAVIYYKERWCKFVGRYKILKFGTNFLNLVPLNYPI